MKFFMLGLLMALTTAGFTSCASTGLNTDLQKIEAGCATASAAMKVLATDDNLHKLPATAQDQVLKAVAVISPTCTQSDPPTLDALKYQAFQQAITILSGYQNKVASPPPN